MVRILSLCSKELILLITMTFGNIQGSENSLRCLPPGRVVASRREALYIISQYQASQTGPFEFGIDTRVDALLASVPLTKYKWEILDHLSVASNETPSFTLTAISRAAFCTG